MGGAPKPPKPVAPPSKTDDQVQQAAADEAARMRMRRGRSSTDLTSLYQNYGTKSQFGA